MTGPAGDDAGDDAGNGGGAVPVRIPVQLVVLAKRPVAGRVKTRLTPPYPPAAAAALAAAALTDTLDAVAAAPVAHRVLAFDGDATGWRRPGFDVVGQRGEGLAARLGAAVEDAYALRPVPVLLVGMDTPQVGAADLAAAARALLVDGTGAVLGPATDGGYWAVGLRVPHPEAFTGVPMSTAGTYAAQRRRFTALGLGQTTLPAFTDVDDAASAAAVAAAAPATGFARRLAELGGGPA